MIKKENEIMVKIQKNIVLLFLFVVVLAGCSIQAPVAPKKYDLGMFTAPEAADQRDERVVIAIPELLMNGAVDGTHITYRYTNVLQNEPKKYQYARWAEHPAELLRFRLQQHLGLRFLVAMTSDFDAPKIWRVRLTVEDFSQHVDEHLQSKGVVQVRATLMQGHTLVAQKLFKAEVPAQKTDEQGAVQALSEATDQIFSGMTNWIAHQVSETLAQKP